MLSNVEETFTATWSPSWEKVGPDKFHMQSLKCIGIYLNVTNRADMTVTVRIERNQFDSFQVRKSAHGHPWKSVGQLDPFG